MTSIVHKRPRRESRWRTRSCLLFLTVLFLAISSSSMLHKGVTVDEAAHIPAGYTYVAFGDFRMNPEHPPLIKILAALPLLWLEPRFETGDPVWRTADPSANGWNRNQWALGSKFLYEWNDADRVIFWARAPIVGLSLLLGLAVYSCARHLYGWKAGIFALALYLFHPDVLAHGQLVTTDMGVAGFMFVAVYRFYCALCRMTPWTIVLAGVAVGLTVVTKFSGVLIFPMLIMIGGAFAYSRVPVTLSAFQKGPRSVSSPRAKLAVALALVVATVLVSLVIIWACYGFRYRVSPDPEISHTLAWSTYLEKPGVVYDVARVIHHRHLVPEAYLYGFLHAYSSMGGRPAFLMGHRSVGGWWYYFPITFLVKTPIPFILLVLLGFILIRRYGAGLAAESMLLLPVGIYWTIAVLSPLNIGHRHLLPIYPFLIAFSSKVARVLDPPRPRVLAAACGALLTWSVLESALVYPHFLGYFNEIAGGPAGGYRWLVDSSVDWGQDLKGLAEYRREHPEGPLYLSYFGMAKPEFYGIRAEFLPGSLNPGLSPQPFRTDVVPFERVASGSMVAVSATNLQCTYLTDQLVPGIQEFMGRLKHLEPIAHIGFSILIYRMP